MSGIFTFLNLMGGLGLFLYGMRIMSDGIQRRAGGNLKRCLDRMTGNRVSAALTGLFVTSVIQSSSATTVLLVSLVNAGMVSLNNSIGVIMGANIGTTLTAWMVSFFGFKFKIASIALPAIAIALTMLFSKKDSRRETATILIGFGLLFLGLSFMKENVPDIKNNPGVLEFVRNFSDMGFLSTLIFVGIGTLLTIVVQSSSAAMAITIVMASQGWINFHMAAAVVHGESVGTRITAYLASLGLGVEAKRTARAHMLFNVIGVIWMLILFVPFCNMITTLIPEKPVTEVVQVVNEDAAPVTSENVTAAAGITQDNTPSGADGTTSADSEKIKREEQLKTLVKWRLSLFHTLFNLTNSMLLIWFVPLIGVIVCRWVKDKSTKTNYYEEGYHISRVPSNVPDALESNLVIARAEIGKMAMVTHDILEVAIQMERSSGDDLSAQMAAVKRMEMRTDDMQRELNEFLTDCMIGDMAVGQARDISAKERIVDELESIADSVYSMTLLFDRKLRKGLSFHMEGQEELVSYTEMVLDFLRYNSDYLAGSMKDEGYNHQRAEEMEDSIDTVRVRLRKRAQDAISSGSDVRGELVFFDVVRHLEHIGDYCLNISQAIRGLY